MRVWSRSARGPSPARSGSAAGLPIAAILSGLETRNLGHEAGFQSRRSTIMEHPGKVAACIRGGKCATGTGCVMGGYISRVGQQILNLAIAKNPTGGNSRSARCGSFEGALVERANRLKSIAGAVRTQRKAGSQGLSFG